MVAGVGKRGGRASVPLPDIDQQSRRRRARSFAGSIAWEMMVLVVCVWLVVCVSLLRASAVVMGNVMAPRLARWEKPGVGRVHVEFSWVVPTRVRVRQYQGCSSHVAVVHVVAFCPWGRPGKLGSVVPQWG